MYEFKAALCDQREPRTRHLCRGPAANTLYQSQSAATIWGVALPFMIATLVIQKLSGDKFEARMKQRWLWACFRCVRRKFYHQKLRVSCIMCEQHDCSYMLAEFDHWSGQIRSVCSEANVIVDCVSSDQSKCSMNRDVNYGGAAVQPNNKIPHCPQYVVASIVE